MTFRSKAAVLAAILFAVAAPAAEVDGKWLGKVEGPMGEMEFLFDFKTEGEKLTGTISNEMMGESEIQDGKIEGDEISFKQVLERRRTITFRYTGKVKDGEIEFTREMEGRGGRGGGPGGGPRGERGGPPEGGRGEQGRGGRRGGMGGKMTFTAKRAPEGASP